MRVIVVALLLTLVGSQKPPSRNQKTQEAKRTEVSELQLALEPGQAYLYSVEITSSVGLQGIGSAESSVKVTSVVKNWMNNNAFLYQLGNVEQSVAAGYPPLSDFTPVQSELNECSNMTWKFVPGKLLMYVSPKTSTTCKNLARVITGNLPMSVKSSTKSYEIQETSIFGDCLTKVNTRDDPKNNMMIFTITKNSNNCKTKSEVVRVPLFLQSNDNILQEGNIDWDVQSIARTKPANNGFVIQEAASHQTITVADFGQVTSKMKMSLTEVTNKLPQQDESLLPKGVNMLFEFPENQPQMLLNDSSCNALFTEVLGSTQGHHEHTDLMLLNECLKRLKGPEQLKIFKKMEAVKPELRSYIANADPVAALKFLKNELHSRNKPSLVILQLLISLVTGNVHHISDEAAAYMIEIIQLLPEQQLVLRNILCLYFAQYMHSSVLSQPEQANKIAEALNKLLIDAVNENNEERTILMLKTANTLGHFSSFKHMKFLLESDKTTERVKAIIIPFLVNNAGQDPIKAQNLLIATIADGTNSPAIRVLACKQLLKTKPNTSMVTAIAHIARQEKRQLGSYLYNMFVNCQHSKSRSDPDLASQCRLGKAITQFRPGDWNFDSNKILFYNTFFGCYNWFNTEIFVLHPNPQIIYGSFTVGASVSNKIPSLLEVSSILKGKTSVLDSAPFYQQSAYWKMKDIEKKLQGFKETPTTNLSGILDISVLGKNVYYLTSEDVKGMVNMQLPDHLKNYVFEFSPSINVKYAHLVPCLCGTPAGLVGTANMQIHFSGSGKTTISHDNLREANVQIQLDSNVGISGQGRVMFGLHSGAMQAGVESKGSVKVNVPVRLDANLDFKLDKYEVNIPLPERTINMLHTSHEAVVVARSLNNVIQVPVLPEDYAVDALHGKFTTQRDNTEQRQHFNKRKIEEHQLLNYPVKIEVRTSKAAADVVSPKNPVTHMLSAGHSLDIVLQAVCPGETVQLTLQRGSEALRMRRDVRHKTAKDPSAAREESDQEWQDPKTEAEEQAAHSFPSDSSISAGFKKKGQSRNTIESRSSNTRSSSESKRRHVHRDKHGDWDKRSPSDSSSSSSDTNEINHCRDKHRCQTEISHSSSDSSSSSSDSSSSSSSDSSYRPSRSSDSSSHRRNRDSSNSSSRRSSDSSRSRDSSSSRSRSSRSSSDSSSSDSSSSDSSRSSSSSSDSSSSSSRIRSSRSSDSSSSSSSRSSDSSSSSSSRSSDSSSSSSSSSRSSDSSSSSSSSRSSDSSSSSRSSDSSSSSSSRSSRSSDSSSSRSSRSSDSSSSSSSRSSDSSSSSSSRSSDSSSNHRESSENVKRSSQKGTPKAIHEMRFKSVQKQQKVGSEEISISSSEEDMKISTDTLRMTAAFKVFCNKREAYGISAAVSASNAKYRVSLKESKASKPFAVLETAVPDPYKVTASLAVGPDLKRRARTEVELGMLNQYSAVQWKMTYSDPSLPPVNYVQSMLPKICVWMSCTEINERNPSQQTTVVLASTSSESWAMVIRTPKNTCYSEELPLPITLAWNPFTQNPQITALRFMAFLSSRDKCIVQNGVIVGFNGEEIHPSMSPHCSVILVQDCSHHKKMMVRMKYTTPDKRDKEVILNLGNHEISLESHNGIISVKRNSTAIEQRKTPPSRDVYISSEKSNHKVAVSAPSFGLENLELKENNLMILVNSQISATCGLCGTLGDFEDKFRKPNGVPAKDQASFSQSWVLTDAACQKHQSVITPGYPPREENADQGQEQP